MRRTWLSGIAWLFLLPAAAVVAVADEEPDSLGGGIPLFRTGRPAPAYTPIAIVYEHRWDVQEAPPPDWQAVYAAATYQARTLGAELVVQATSGEDDRLIQNGRAKWFLGIAARFAATADSLVECDNCIVDWLPFDGGSAGAADSAALAELEWKAFALARQRLGERGYYLRNRFGLSGDTTAAGAAPANFEDPAYLALQIAVRRGPVRAGSASVEEISILSRLSWKVSNGEAWARTLTIRPSSRRFDYVSGPDGDSVRNLLSALYTNLEKRGPTPDTDGDGVPDSRDEQWGTQKGARVNLVGVALDDDGDGVPNGIDRDPQTRRGLMVDQWGVPVDEDHDGVPDYLDQCPDTPADFVVNEQGCQKEEWVVVLEDVLLDKGVLKEQLQFNVGSADLLPAATARLDSIGVALAGLPMLRFRVDGHCDDQGDDEYNVLLSRRRAQATIDYLVSRFDGLSRTQFTAEGFGKSKPLVPGTDDAARAVNRRVEFVVENPEDAKRQVEMKRIQRRGGGAGGP